MIPNLQTEDTGNFWCKARNVWGEVNATFPVKVYGKFYALWLKKSLAAGFEHEALAWAIKPAQRTAVGLNIKR